MTTTSPTERATARVRRFVENLRDSGHPTCKGVDFSFDTKAALELADALDTVLASLAARDEGGEREPDAWALVDADGKAVCARAHREHLDELRVSLKQQNTETTFAPLFLRRLAGGSNA